jgi:hypothetical protein
MTTYLDLSKSENLILPYLPNTLFKKKFEGKGWSFSSVFHFSELKDIYLAIRTIGYTSKNEFTRRCLGELKIRSVSTPWDTEGRRILEHVNALINFGLIDSDYKIVDDSIFRNSSIGEKITVNDKEVFKRIYFSYYRFKEIMSWFLDPISSNRENVMDLVDERSMELRSKAIYPFSSKSRFTDSFIYNLHDNTPIYTIIKDENESNGGILRFWDVFVKWGQELELIEKFNLTNLDIQLTGYKSLSCIYFKKPLDESFDLKEYIKHNYNSTYISIPKLILRIATEFRYPVESIKRSLVKQCLDNPDQFSLQRTSEVFIRNTEIHFVPIVNGSYVSHILVL